MGDAQRKSKNNFIRNGEQKFLKSMEERGFNILSGKTRRDWDGEFTYI